MKKYHTKTPQNVYLTPPEEFTQTADDFLESIRQKNIAQYTIQIQYSGHNAEIKIFPTWKHKGQAPKAPKKAPTREVQENLNYKNAVRQLTRILNHNYKPYEDWYGTFTADDNHLCDTAEECEKQAINFLNRFKYKFKSLGVECKCIYKPFAKKAKSRTGQYIRTADGNYKYRLHIHFVVNAGVSVKDMVSTWKLGKVCDLTKLRYYKEGFVLLAAYFIKHNTKGKRKWSCTNNLEKPPKPKNIFRHKQGKKTKIFEIAKNENIRPAYFETLLKGFEFVESEAKYNDINDGVYIYCRMALKEMPTGRKREWND